MASRLASRRFGTPAWDWILRGTGVAGALACVLAACWKDAASLTAFVLLTIWVHGPISPLLPAAYEPTLMLFGRLYPPLFIAVLGLAGNLYVETFNYHLFVKLGGVGPYRRLQQRALFESAVRMFRRRPFVVTWLFAWSPLPFWIIRLLAPAARYPLKRYLAAVALGRLPRFWLLAALGAWFRPPAWLLITIALGSGAITLLAIARKRPEARAARAAPNPATGIQPATA